MNIASMQSVNFGSNINRVPMFQNDFKKETRTTKEDIANLRSDFYKTFGKDMPESMEDALIITGYTFDDDNEDLIIHPEVHYFKSNPINYDYKTKL